MSSQNWQSVKLSEITSKIGSGATPRGGKESYKDSGITLIRSLNVYDFYFDYDGLAYIDEKQAEELDNVDVKPKDILLNITGASVARCCIVPERLLPARVNQHVSIIRVKPEIANPHFVFYTINSPFYKSHLLTLAQGGATREALTKETIEKFEIPLPPLPIQRRIADILSAYDDLIENNTRRIRILEGMAQAIYQEWFGKVDKESLPEGWEVIEVKQIINRLPKGTVYEQQDVIEEGEVIVIDQSRAEFLGFHNNTPDFEASPSNPIAIFGDHTCKMQLLVRPFSIGPNVVPFASKLSYPIHYVFSVVSGLVETKEYKRHWNDLSAKKVALPPLELAKEFSVIIEPMLAQQDMLARKNAILRQTRDFLLPRLVSGEIEVTVHE